MRLCAAAVLGLVVGGGRAMDDNTIRTAVAAWESDRAAAEAQYGPISAWDTADVVDMKELFRYTEKNEFNENIGAWNTSSVTSMNRMFSYAHKFNQPIGVFAASFCAGTPSTRSTHAGAWDVRKVKDFECMFCYAEVFNQDIGDWRVDNAETINRMFYGASAFDQDLGWCTLATVDQAFLTSPCQSNDCGVLRGVRAEDPGALGACEPEKTPAPTPDPEGRVCNGGPYDGRRCQNHGFCQQPDPSQPDIDACDDCKCITRKDSDGAARTSSSGCFLVFVLGVLFGVS